MSKKQALGKPGLPGDLGTKSRMATDMSPGNQEWVEICRGQKGKSNREEELRVSLEM